MFQGGCGRRIFLALARRDAAAPCWRSSTLRTVILLTFGMLRMQAGTLTPLDGQCCQTFSRKSELARAQADYRMEFVAVQSTGRIWICFMLSGLTGCAAEKPAYQPYYVVVPYTPGTNAKT